VITPLIIPRCCYLFAEPLIRVFIPPTRRLSNLRRSCCALFAYFPAGSADRLRLCRRSARRRSTRVPRCIFNAFSNWVFRVSASFIAVRYLHYGLDSIALFIGIDMTIRAVLFTLRFRSGKWKTAIKG
jgi:Na+-driven multidrug efflux pump